jgi:outer membrane beta-barrel protein
MSAATALTAAVLAALAAVAVLAPRAAHAADAPDTGSGTGTGSDTGNPDTTTAGGNDQVITPDMDRRDVHKPRYPSNDIELDIFGGGYTTSNFGSSGVAGGRLGYHITEDFFVEGSFGYSKVSDKAFRQILPGGIFASGIDTLRYREVTLGWNALPGEVFLGSKHAKPSSIYFLGGLGTTSFDEQRAQTFVWGMGARVLFTDWFALRLDVRDHVFAIDLLGKRQIENNPELTTSLAFFF